MRRQESLPRSTGGAFLHETLATMFMITIVLAICDPKNWRPKNGLLPIAIGLLITVIDLSFSYNEGLAMNPARDLSPRIFTYIAGWGVEVFSFRNYNYFWIPIVGSHVRIFFRIHTCRIHRIFCHCSLEEF